MNWLRELIKKKIGCEVNTTPIPFEKSKLETPLAKDDKTLNDTIKSDLHSNEIARPVLYKEPEIYLFPPTELLISDNNCNEVRQELLETTENLEFTLQSLGVNAVIVNITRGPSITRYELKLRQVISIHKLINLTDDIKLRLPAPYVHIEASAFNSINIDVSNKKIQTVLIRQLLESSEFINAKSKTSFIVGKDLLGKTIIADIKDLQHILIAGHTGSGKSVWINTMVISLLYKASPSELKFLMIDSKAIELTRYNGIPHLLTPVVTDPNKAVASLKWAVNEMESRYKKFKLYGVSNITEYNLHIDKINDTQKIDCLKKMPQLIIIIDDLTDLITTEKYEMDTVLKKLTQASAKTGIYLIIVTQRPSVDIISGAVKSNIPSRIAFSVVSGTESKIIMSQTGAEKLCKRGEMLFQPYSLGSPIYIQGAFISDDEINKVVNFLYFQTRNTNNAFIDVQRKKFINNEKDELFEAAGRFIIEQENTSIGNLQRHFRIGFNRAAHIMDQLYAANVVSVDLVTKPRTILMTLDDFEKYLANQKLKKTPRADA